MKTRIITGALLLLLLAFALTMGGWVFAVICTAAICIALYEMIHALKEAGYQIVQWPVWMCTVVSIPCLLLYKNMALLPMVVFTCMIVTAYILFHGEPRLVDLLTSLLPLFAVTLPGMCLLAQINAPTRMQQLLLLCTSFLIPTVGDASAYFIGVRFGKTKLIPAVSPKKTVAGAVAGWCGSVMAALAVYGVISLFVKPDEVMPPLWHFAVLGVLGGIVGQLGDLFASLVKRHCGIKDYGHIFPGHGGMMDRLDSVLFTATLIYLYQSVNPLFFP